MKLASLTPAALVAFVLVSAATAGAQTNATVAPLAPPAVRFSTPGVRDALAAREPERFLAPQWAPRWAPPRTSHRTARTVAGAILGGFGGFLAGGLVGAKIEPPCRCDDPGLQGFVIGAPIGAVLGAIAGFKLASP